MTRKNISQALNNVSNRHIEEIMNFQETKEELKMKKINNTRTNWRPATIAAALVVCICLSGVTALAATGALQGFFKDILGWNGAVIGTSYEQASEEIEIKATPESNHLVVEMTMLYPNKAPYNEIEMLGIKSYKIVDMNNQVIAEGTSTDMAEIADKNVSISISFDNLSDAAYKLVISELTGSKKANQPITLSGSWECDFTK